MIKFGLQIPWMSWPGSPENDRDVFRNIAQAAEEAGFSTLWVMDHFFQLPGIGEMSDDMLECYSTLGYLAGVTERIGLGALVTGVTYRHPGVLLKSVSTLDVLSGGRMILGIGAAWFELEHNHLGIPFPPVKERFERLEETLQIAKQKWADDDRPFEGKHYQLGSTLSSPQPLQKPHPPIMIGGNGEKRTLRLAAKYGDASNLVYVDADTVKSKLEVLKRHCDEVDRDYNTLEKSALAPLGPGQHPKALVAEYIDAGIEHLIVNTPDPQTLETIKVFEKEIIPEFS